MLRREVGEAVGKAKPGGRIVDVEVTGPGALHVVVEDRGARHRAHVISWGRYTAAVVHNPTLSLPRSGTYAIGEQTSTLAAEVLPNGVAEVRERIGAVIDATLPTRGFHRVNAGAPDIIVAYHTAIDGPLSATELQESRGYTEADWVSEGGSDPDESAGARVPVYEKGSLILDVLEAATKRLAWRAAVVADIVIDVPVTEKELRIRDAVELALRFFPPRPCVSVQSSGECRKDGFQS
jgi:hypothetical protein